MNNTRGGSKRRKYIDVELSKYNDRQKENLNSLLCNQDKDIIFEKPNEEYVAHVQFVNTPNVSKSPRKKVTPFKDITDSKNRPFFQNPAINNHQQQTEDVQKPSKNQEQPQPLLSHKPGNIPSSAKEPYIPETTLKTKLNCMEKWKPYFQNLNLNSIPCIRPILIGRMFMTEKIEQCYHFAMQDWMTLKKQNTKITLRQSVDDFYKKIYSKGKAVYNQNLTNILYSADKLGMSY